MLLACACSHYADSPFDAQLLDADHPCTLADQMGDLGDLPAMGIRHNQPGSKGAAQFDALIADVPGTHTRIQLELWDGQGVFIDGFAHAGTYPIQGTESLYATCGVCLRAIGEFFQPDAEFYAAGNGTVTIDRLGDPGTPFAAHADLAIYYETNSFGDRLMDGCRAHLASVRLSGTLVLVPPMRHRHPIAAAIAATIAAIDQNQRVR